MVDVDELSKGVELGWTSEEVQKYAKQFMKDNGYKLTEAGKQVAIAELQDLQDNYPPQIIAVITTAISLLSEEE